MEMQQVATIGWYYQLVPSAISVFLILFSTRFSRPFERVIDNHPYECYANEEDERDGGAKDFAKRMAKGWAAQVGFHSAMLAALASAVAVATDPLRVWLLIASVVVLAVVELAWTMALHGRALDDIHEGRVSIATRLDLTLILLNGLIALVITLNPDDRRAAVSQWVCKLFC